MGLTRLALYVGALWLVAAIWHSNGGHQSIIWMLMIPATYLVVLQILKD